MFWIGFFTALATTGPIILLIGLMIGVESKTRGRQ